MDIAVGKNWIYKVGIVSTEWAFTVICLSCPIYLIAIS